MMGIMSLEKRFFHVRLCPIIFFFYCIRLNKPPKLYKLSKVIKIFTFKNQSSIGILKREGDKSAAQALAFSASSGLKASRLLADPSELVRDIRNSVAAAAAQSFVYPLIPRVPLRCTRG
jgi:hypothetical protein